MHRQRRPLVSLNSVEKNASLYALVNEDAAQGCHYGLLRYYQLPCSAPISITNCAACQLVTDLQTIILNISKRMPSRH